MIDPQLCKIWINDILMQSLDQVDIETTTYCNRKCVYCPNYSFGRKSMLMEEKIFLKIVESLNKIGFKGTVCPHLFGEPLSDPRIIKFIELIRYYCPQSSITLYTNGDYLTIEKYRELKSAGINYLVISQHSEKLPDTTKCLIDYVSGYHLAELESISCVNYYSEYYKKDKTDLLNNRGGTVIIPNAGKSSLTCSLVNQLTFDIPVQLYFAAMIIIRLFPLAI